MLGGGEQLVVKDAAVACGCEAPGAMASPYRVELTQADRIRQLQIANIDALFACETKMAEDENKAQLEFFKQRLIDTIEEKQKKTKPNEPCPCGSGKKYKKCCRPKDMASGIC